MERFVVLLRGVNVGGRNRIAMAALRALLEDLGCRDVVTYVQSGNAVVDWPGSSQDVAAAVEAALRDRLDLPVAVLVRSVAELAAVVARCPLPADDPKLLHVVFLGGQLEQPVPEVTPDRIEVGDRVLYVRYAVASQDSRAAKWLNAKAFPLVATARNWRTVAALQELAER